MSSKAVTLTCVLPAKESSTRTCTLASCSDASKTALVSRTKVICSEDGIPD
ncbi:hypothetical protein ACFPRL_24005 [Pseudoclavibacter helvolus]